MRSKRKSFPQIYAIIILVTIIYFAFSMSKSISLRNQKLDILAENNIEIKNLNNEIKDLKREINKADTIEFVEKVARDDLGMVKPREIVYIDKSKGSSFNLHRQNQQEDK